MGASGCTAAVAEDAAAADASEDFLSRILGSFLGESVTAAEVEGSDAGGTPWDCSGSIF